MLRRRNHISLRNLQGFPVPTLAFPPVMFLLIACFLINFNGSQARAEEGEGGRWKYTNRLVSEKSPYLLQHAHNPVDWYPWGEEAFKKARKEGKLVFLSIGYSTCHWCHVMERESFEDEEVAKILNRDFVAIKVDREERPDIDRVYMLFALSLSGSGGWPLNVLMVPDGSPFFAGSYFPKNPAYGLPGLMGLLETAASVWKEDPEKVLESGKKIAKLMKDRAGRKEKKGTFDKSILEKGAGALVAAFDSRNGGFGKAPKFPRPQVITFLIRRYRRTGENKFLQMAEETLRSMRNGGLFDQVGYGFHRYSTDEKWFLPHFEKMLYDQGGIALAYVEAYGVTGKKEYEKTAIEILEFALRDMKNEGGGFYTALDADSEGEEGKFYYWEKEEVLQVLGKEDGELFSRAYGVTGEGNASVMAGVGGASPNILYRKLDPRLLADEISIPEKAVRKQLERGRNLLYLERKKRVHPSIDDKIITAWNGLMISALSRAGSAFGNMSYVLAAEETARFVLQKMRTEKGRLMRRFRGGHVAVPAFLEDYAYFSRGLLDLYRATLDLTWLREGVSLSEELVRLFSDRESYALFDTGRDAESLIFRPVDIYDGARPSGNSIALELFARLFYLTGKAKWSNYGRKLLEGVAVQVGEHPEGYLGLLQGASLFVEPVREVVVTGMPGRKDTLEMLDLLRKNYSPETVFLFRPIEGRGGIVNIAPYLSGMKPVLGKAAAYVCQNFSCNKPTTDPSELARILKKAP